jgi:RNA polymerase sigma-70 factor (ECF subfamily)
MYLLYALILALFRLPSRGVSLDTLSDEELMARFQGGDERAFERLVARLERPVAAHIARLTSHPDNIPDLLQETLMRVARNAHHYQPSARVLTWTFAIAKNLCIDAYRKERGHKMVSMDQDKSPEGDHFTLHHLLADDRHEHQPEAQTEERELLEAVREALEHINPDQREVFLMREVHGYKFHEIATIIGETESTIKSRMRYAVQSLQRRLSSYGGDS